MPETYDVVIIGGAVIGSSIAYFLTSNPDFGGSVLIIERDPTFAQASTSLSASGIRNQFSNPINVQIGQFGTAFIRSFAEVMEVNGEQPELNFHEGGYLFLEGRADDVIVKGGENMSPGEIEDVLLGHEAVSDCGVCGIPDEQWGETVAAAVVLKAGKTTDVESLQKWVKEHLRSSRVPQVIRFYEELPYNETGKLLRRVIKAELSEAE